MKYIIVDSSMIDLVGYDQKAQVLEVRFGKSDEVYRYFNVPRKIYAQLIKASSKGSYMNSNVIGCFEYIRVKENKGERE